MELIKQNIHMDRVRCQALTQITLEEDFNIPDQKRDVSSIHLEKGEIIFDEIRPFQDYVNVSGKLKFRFLYHTKEEGCELQDMEGAIPFREKINLTGVTPGDQVNMSYSMEDLNINLINSRKVSVQSVVTLQVKVEELYDLLVPTGMEEEEMFEYCKTSYPVSEIKVFKNDIFRVKEEISIPGNYPNMFRILWNSFSLQDMEYRVLEDKVSLGGELQLFCMYEGEGEDHPIRTYETSIPFRGELECSGCEEGMLPNIRCRIATKEMDIRPDLDGEERILGVEVVLDLAMKLYEEDEVELLTDIYGIGMEVETKEKLYPLRKLLSHMEGKLKVAEEITLPSQKGGILQMLHSEGSAQMEEVEILEEGLRMAGILTLKLLYITGEDENPYGDYEKQIPFHYTLEIPDLKKGDPVEVECEVEQLRITLSQGDSADLKAILCFHVNAFRENKVEAIWETQVSPIDSVKLSKLPAMAIYFVKPMDTLWKIGKQYYVPVDMIKKLNGLTDDQVKVGQKLLIVKTQMLGTE